MPIVLIGLGVLIGGLILQVLHDREPTRATQVTIGAEPSRPPLAYVGDAVFSLPQVQWGTVERVGQTSQGWVYGVRYPDGLATVLHECEIGASCAER